MKEAGADCELLIIDSELQLSRQIANLLNCATERKDENRFIAAKLSSFLFLLEMRVTYLPLVLRYISR